MMMNGWDSGGWTPPTPNPYGQVPIQPIQQPDWGQLGMMAQASNPASANVNYAPMFAAVGKTLGAQNQAGDTAAQDLQKQQMQQNQQRQTQFQGAAPAANQALAGAMGQMQQRPAFQASPFAQQQGGLVNYLRQMYGMGH